MMRIATGVRFASRASGACRRLFLCAIVVSSAASCKTRNVSEAETTKDVTWLAEQGTPEAVAALGRIADSDAKALSTLESRAQTDVNTYIAAWGAVTRSAPWGTTFLRSGLGD